MPQRDIVVIGGSAGGLKALTTILDGLSPHFPASIFVVIHARLDSNGVLPQILSRRSPLPVQFASHQLTPKRGRVYVARPDFQLLLTPHAMLVTRGPRENGFRPAVDPLFRTAAHAFGARVIGVILSGGLDDGTYGLSMVKKMGGIAVIQSPDEAEIPSMPASAQRQVEIDYALPATEIAGLLSRLVEVPGQGESAMARAKDPEPQLPGDVTDVAEMEELFGPPSGLTCPDCGGALWELESNGVLRYKCHVGHQFGPDSLIAEQRDTVEGALWSAVRVLEEHAELRTRMARRAEGAGLAAVASGFDEGAQNAHQQANAIRALLFGGGGEVDALEEAATQQLPTRRRKNRSSRKPTKRKTKSKQTRQRARTR